MKICVDCGQEFDPCESLMGDEGQCQLCWEAVCDRSWWEYMRRLDEVLGPVAEEA
jgi:hypothetical protein